MNKTASLQSWLCTVLVTTVVLLRTKCVPWCMFVREERQCMCVLGESQFSVANDCLPMSLIKDLYI